MNLAELYRPQTWAEIVGVEPLKAAVRRLRARGLGGRCFWIHGPSSSGKTTAARIIAREVASDMNVEELDAPLLTPPQIDEWETLSHIYGWGQGGRGFICNECHRLTPAAIGQLLIVLERVPQSALWIFTTTTPPDEYQTSEDRRALLSRCHVLTTSCPDPATVYAPRLAGIASAEGYDLGLDEAQELIARCGGNLRAALAELETRELVA